MVLIGRNIWQTFTGGGVVTSQSYRDSSCVECEAQVDTLWWSLSVCPPNNNNNINHSKWKRLNYLSDSRRREDKPHFLLLTATRSLLFFLLKFWQNHSLVSGIRSSAMMGFLRWATRVSMFSSSSSSSCWAEEQRWSPYHTILLSINKQQQSEAYRQQREKNYSWLSSFGGWAVASPPLRRFFVTQNTSQIILLNRTSVGDYDSSETETLTRPSTN